VSGVERFPCSILTCSAARVRRLGSFFQMGLSHVLSFPQPFYGRVNMARFVDNARTICCHCDSFSASLERHESVTAAL
jgi:hypothetical protein